MGMGGRVARGGGTGGCLGASRWRPRLALLSAGEGTAAGGGGGGRSGRGLALTRRGSPGSRSEKDRSPASRRCLRRPRPAAASRTSSRRRKRCRDPGLLRCQPAGSNRDGKAGWSGPALASHGTGVGKRRRSRSLRIPAGASFQAAPSVAVTSEDQDPAGGREGGRAGGPDPADRRRPGRAPGRGRSRPKGQGETPRRRPALPAAAAERSASTWKKEA